MSSERPAPPRDGWRRAGAPTRRERRKSGPKWRRGVDPAVPRWRRRVRALKVTAAVLTLGVLAGLLIWVSTWLWPLQPAALVLVGAGYEQNLAIPHNAYGVRSLRRLAALALPPGAPTTWGSGRLRLQDGPLTFTGDVAWDEGLAQFRGRTLVLFLALHGGSDRDGAYLLPEDADARPIARNRLRLTAVLDRLAKLPAEVNKVLVLDATQIQSHWTLGMIENNFARDLAGLEPRVLAIPRLVVLSASDVDQCSWSCDALGQTVFASALIEGLQGAAAGDDGRTNAEELFVHVRRNVERWAGLHLLERQTPVLLPGGDAGRRRARAIELCGAAGLAASPAASTVVAAAAGRPPDRLLDAWRAFGRLQQAVPPPWIYRPHTWRLYKDTLIRYDELTRAGSVRQVTELGLELGELERQLGRSQFLELGSAQGTLAMPAVEGRMAADSEALRRPFETLWEASPAEAATLWQQLQDASPRSGTGPDDLRRGLLDLLIRRAADDHAGQLEKAVRLARLLVDPAGPAPAEVHELIMIARDLPGEVARGRDLGERVAQAIRVRRLAERAALIPADRTLYPYGELVLPWVRARCDEADTLRRRGLDLLFTSDAVSWGEAGDLLDRAERIYREAEDDAARVRAAYATRDEVLAALPDYTRWLARIRPYASRVRKVRLDELEGVMERLWESTHALVAALERGDPRAIRGPADGEPTSQGLVGLGESVRGMYREVEAGFTVHVQAIDEIALSRLWYELRIALSVPFNDLRMRTRLLASLDRIEQRFLVTGADVGDAFSPATEADNRARSLQRARIQGLMDLDVLGRSWFDSLGGSEPDRFVKAHDRLARLGDDPSWPRTLLEIGELVGRAWLEMPVAIDRLMAEGIEAASPGDRVAVGSADLLWRQLDGTLNLKTTAIPSEVFRRIMVRDVLLWEAGRALTDHWYAEDPVLAPYYRAAGLRFVGDARRLDPRPAAHQDTAREMQAAIERPGGLGFQGPARLAMTSERRLAVEYRLRTDPGPWSASGSPVIWADPGRELESLAPEAGRRFAQALGTRTEAPIVCTIASPLLDRSEETPPPAPRVERSTFAVRGLFRGQRFALETAMDLHLLPEVVMGQHPVPAGASLSVRAEDGVLDRLGSSNGAIAIVLDCSGSMGPASGQAWGPTTKYREATGALRQVLQQLTKGTVVSVWAFGQAIGPDKTVKDAERTIIRIQDPLTWDPGNADQLKRLMDRVEYPALEPWNESPIVRTMLRARDDLRNVPGFKTLLVVTDGMDNRYEEDSLWNPHKVPIPAAIRASFEDSGIEVNIIGYKVVGAEAARARAQFRVIEELPVPGKFYEVNDVRALAAVLAKAMGRRLRFWVEGQDNVLASGVPSQGLMISQVGGNDRWLAPALAPGGYKLVIDPLRRQERSLAFNNGDLLLVQLAPSRSGVEFRRAEFAREDYSWRPSIEKNRWYLAVLQDQQIGVSGLQMLCTLEKSFNRSETCLEVIRPREVWIELSPWPETDTPFALRWSNRTGYPAPAWTLDVPRWPSSPGTSTAARPSLRVWWNPDQVAPASGGLDRGPDFDLDTGRAADPVPIGGDGVIVESVRVEDHPVETRPGVREVRPCLVVRLAHAPGKPISVRPMGLVPAGSEHRFYAAAARTTALFWPVTRDAAASLLTGLSLYSVEAFKAQAERRGFSIEMRDLAPPTPDDLPPQEVPIRGVGVSVLPFD